MNNSDIRGRLRPDRPMVTITMRIPADVVEDLKRVAPRLGFSGYQPLIRAYIGHGLRSDLSRLHSADLADIADTLRRHGVSEEVIAAVVADAGATSAAA